MMGAFVAAAFMALGIFSLIFWLWMLVDCILNPSLGISGRILWILLIVFGSVIGAIIYMALGRASPDLVAKGKKRLFRPSKGRMLLGVCAGIAHYLSTDPTIVRVLWVIGTFISMGTGILLYLVLAIVIPAEPAR